MTVEITNHVDHWQAIKDATMNTIGKLKGKYPDTNWKKALLRSEHSPIRHLVVSVVFKNIPYWVAMHFTRHKIGVEHFVSTQRTDRTGKQSRGSQEAPVTYRATLNAQAVMNISRKRLCMCASTETRHAWKSFLDCLQVCEPELYSLSVKECVYRGYCPEMFPCGYSKTEAFEQELKNYRG